MSDTTANGLVNMLGVKLQEGGYPSPLIAIVDRRSVVRHMEVYSPKIG